MCANKLGKFGGCGFEDASIPLGAILSSKARADDQLHKARQSARTVIHALHKAQEKLTNEQVNEGYTPPSSEGCIYTLHYRKLMNSSRIS